MVLAITGTAAAQDSPASAATTHLAVADSTYPVAGGLDLSIWNGLQALGNGIHSGVNVLFGGAYGGGGNPFGSDQGTWWYQLGRQIDTWSQNYNQHGTHTCYDGNTPYPCG